MYEKVLSKDAKQSLALLGKSGILKSAYLAGGTALALQIGHRYSFVLNFKLRVLTQTFNLLFVAI